MNRIKFVAIVLFVLPLMLLSTFKAVPTHAALLMPDDPAVTYKAKCAMCHSPKAEKKFDATKEDAVLVDSIRKGVKPATPPNMPAYEGKITPEDAQALATYMKSLKTAAN